MRASRHRHPDERLLLPELREFSDRAFSRAAGAPLVGGNSVRLLKNAAENYPAWLAAIRAAKHHVNFESYIIHDDGIGREFAGVLIEKAREGVAVRLVYDWMGGFGKTSWRFWKRLRSGGVEVRCYNPPRLSSPLGWLSRDHRKMLTVDGEVGFITGLCVGRMWVGDPARGIDPWRDTGVEIHGPSVSDIEKAFARIWSMTGEPLPGGDSARKQRVAGNVNLRVVATEPATAGLMRLDQLIAALARNRLWLTDAYYAGTTVYVQALRAAAKDGVDVRLLVPNGTDIPLLRPLSRVGYRPLLEAGIRVFEWNGIMLHAKTAVADGHWARVGSSNLNIASWFANCELDAVIEDDSFALEMEQSYLEDLANATEVVLDEKRKLRVPGEPPHPHPATAHGGGTSGRAAAGVVRIGHAIGAAFTDRRVLGPIEARLAATAGLLLCALAVLFSLFPRVLIYPVVVLCVWGGLALLYRAYRLRRGAKGGG
ncbi:MAG: cardiolipin synthase B [Bryobacterales bacterium]|nr:cardiolipin synthase B [Bryobacterales bacterium]